jgi:hypothetical protein
MVAAPNNMTAPSKNETTVFMIIFLSRTLKPPRISQRPCQEDVRSSNSSDKHRTERRVKVNLRACFLCLTRRYRARFCAYPAEILRQPAVAGLPQQQNGHSGDSSKKHKKLKELVASFVHCARVGDANL